MKKGLLAAKVMAMAVFGFSDSRLHKGEEIQWNPTPRGPGFSRSGRSRSILRIKAEGDKLSKLARRHACGVSNPSRMITKYDFHTKQWKIGLLVA